MKFVITMCCLVVSVITVTEGADWDYGAHGPSTWSTNYPICGQRSQSPIDIDTEAAMVDSNLGIFDRNWYRTPPTEMNLINNGHSLQMNILSGANEIDNDAFLPFRAIADQYHFHWASTYNGAGSEHKLDGKQMFGEMHIVHHNAKYADLSTAVSQADGLAVLGFFFKEGYPQDNPAVEQIFKYIGNNKIQAANDNVTITDGFSIETLLPSDTAKYYRYAGSLTTPSCDESVLWTVFKEPIEISESQARLLASALSASDSTTIGNNFRPTQPLNGRVVKASPDCVVDSAISFRPSLLALPVTLLLAYLM